MNDRNYKLLKDIYSKFSKKLKELIDSANVDKIGEILFTHNGIKNYIHIKLKEPKNKEVKELFEMMEAISPDHFKIIDKATN